MNTDILISEYLQLKFRFNRLQCQLLQLSKKKSFTHFDNVLFEQLQKVTLELKQEILKKAEQLKAVL